MDIRRSATEELVSARSVVELIIVKIIMEDLVVAGFVAEEPVVVRSVVELVTCGFGDTSP